MAETLATMRAAIRTLLDDPSTDRFTDTIIDQGLTVALAVYSQRKPVIRTYALDSTGTRRIVLPADFTARTITNVEWVSDLADFRDEIAFYATKQDEQWMIELPGNSIPLGEVLNVEYQALNTVDGLAGAAGTTVPDEDISLLAMGSAGFASLSRATSQIEDNNLNPQEAKDLVIQGRTWIDQFYTGIGDIQTMFTHATINHATIDRNY